ncbi:CHASE2 domain-containing protein [Paraburkholderia sprentiae WSM5005]|uniref:CHASE2 domain-containing protein n=1 Tax=Paraburkholderia sprentiae WSM5005 TaxID=754502 RepID=A0A1I9YCQ6_9BURK|nr:CHASE2 domain-containing protein [Paraburkholderia sprentiae]APA84089.1 CHASE2 domain-containing protein [Paraburkholderia sprentiae WSM5005]
MLTALIIMAVIFIVQNSLSNSGFADYLRAWSFAYLEAFLPDTTAERLQVVVMDIGEIAGGTPTQPLDRQKLWEIIDGLHDAEAAVVGIDNDFSPGPTGWRVPHGEYSDPKFFSHCQQWPEMPVVLGVFHNADLSPNAWLGASQFKGLAAYIGSAPIIEDARLTRAETHYSGKAGATELPSMGYALAQKYVTTHSKGAFPQPGSWLSLVVEPVGEPERVQLVNFSKLGQMTRESIWLPEKDPTGAANIPHYFKGKIVLLGDINPDNPRVIDSTDRFFAPGRKEEQPGVLYHASAAYTFGFAPIYEFNKLTSVVLDILLGGIFLFAVWLQTRYQPQSRGIKAKIVRLAEQYALIVAAILLVVIALIAITYFNILWLDAAWVALGLLLHYALPPHVKELFPKWTGGDFEEAS